MNKLLDPRNVFSDQEDYYMTQTRVLVDLYLLEHGVTNEGLRSMSEEDASLILKQALDYASDQIARRDAMIRIGQRESEPKPESNTRRQHGDLVKHHFNRF